MRTVSASKPCRAGFGPHCQVLRTGHPGSPHFVPLYRGNSGPTFPTAERARAWLAIAEITGYRSAPSANDLRSR